MAAVLKNVKVGWIVGALAVAVILLGLFFDMYRTYSIRSALQADLDRVALETAEANLPWYPERASDMGLRALIDQGYSTHGRSVIVSEDGNEVTISAISESRAYFAWLVGKTTFRFEATSTARVAVEGGGPVRRIEASDIAFGIDQMDDFSLGVQYAVTPSGASTGSEFEILAHAVSPASGGEMLSIGEALAIRPIRAFNPPEGGRVRLHVVIMDVGEDGRTVAGFGSFEPIGLDAEGRLLGRFAQEALPGLVSGGSISGGNFGLVRIGNVRAELE